MAQANAIAQTAVGCRRIDGGFAPLALGCVSLVRDPLPPTCGCVCCDAVLGLDAVCVLVIFPFLCVYVARSVEFAELLHKL